MDTSTVKARRKALGWSRADLADRSGINTPTLGLIERGLWDESDSLTRVAYILDQAEAGNLDARLAAPTKEETGSVPGLPS